MQDISHLNALEANLFKAKVQLKRATKAGEIALRTVWVAQLEKEVAGERKFLGLLNSDSNEPKMTDDELLAALSI